VIAQEIQEMKQRLAFSIRDTLPILCSSTFIDVHFQLVGTPAEGCHLRICLCAEPFFRLLTIRNWHLTKPVLVSAFTIAACKFTTETAIIIHRDEFSQKYRELELDRFAAEIGDERREAHLWLDEQFHT
jgi:hypothetical protein